MAKNMDLQQYYCGNEQHAFNPAPQPAGLVVTRRNRKTHNMVSIYNARSAGMDAFAGEWATVCEKHGTIINHQTQKLVYSHLSVPLEWCEQCRAEHEAEFAALDKASQERDY